MKVLISGAGIAGTCLAYWLKKHGFEPTLVERASHLRTGGYIIDFWGAGFDVAERMGLIPRLLKKGYQVQEIRQVDRGGERISGLAVNALKRVTHGRFTSLPRGELAVSIYEALGGGVETLFGDGIASFEDLGDEVRVRFERAQPRSFDLLIGADGLHSRVRRLAFGEDARFEQYLGLKVAAFVVDGYRPRDELAYVVHSEIGQQIGRFSMRDDRSVFLFVFTDQNPTLPAQQSAQKALLREKFGSSGWESAEILAALDATDDLYIDKVSQIRMPGWTRGRVALLGDAAFCVSFLGGQGSALAMVAAYVLAGELKRANGSHELAFAQYEMRLADLMLGKQKAAVKLKSFFAPRSRVSMFLRNQVMKLMAIPVVAELVVGRELRDAIELPQY